MEIRITDNKELAFEAIANSAKAYDSIEEIYNSVCFVFGYNYPICKHLKWVMDDLKKSCCIKKYILSNYRFKNVEEQIESFCKWLEEDDNQNNK